MAHTKKIGSAGRFGPRYGRKIRYKVAVIEKKQKAKQECPRCGKLKVKRLAQGIYFCKHCKTKMTGLAYTLN